MSDFSNNFTRSYLIWKELSPSTLIIISVAGMKMVFHLNNLFHLNLFCLQTVFHLNNVLFQSMNFVKRWTILCQRLFASSLVRLLL